jgi:glyceraldehyde 3-phosphate dehydrogenase
MQTVRQGWNIFISRPWWLIGNPKVEQTQKQEILDHARDLARTAQNIESIAVGYAPLAELLFSVGEIFENSSVGLGSQRVPWDPGGLHTGGTSPVILKEAGVIFGLIGHREARDEFGEGPYLKRQIKIALDYGIIPILCCGEPKGSLVESETVRKEALEAELIPALEGFTPEELLRGQLAIAYEPGHVIGLDQPADMGYIRTGFSLIKKILLENNLEALAHKVRFLYGGGVNSDTIQQVWGLNRPTKAFSGENWSGFLVGRASASPDFMDMMEKWQTKLGRTRAKSRVFLTRAEEIEEVITEVPPIAPSPKKLRVAVYGVGEVGVGFITSVFKEDNIDIVQLFNMEVDAEDIRARIYKSLFIDKDKVFLDDHHVVIRDEVNLEGEIELDGEAVELKSLLGSTGNDYSRIVKVLRDQRMLVTPAHDPKEAAAQLVDDIDIVFFTVGGLLKERRLLTPFLEAGAKHIIVSSTSQAADISIIPGYNHHLFNPALHKIIALGSCTSNCGIPIAAIIEEALGKGSILGSLVVTMHSKTNSQQIGDKGAEPKEEGLLNNLILTTTGIKDILNREGFFPSIGTAIDAFSTRAPVEKASLLVMLLQVQWAEGLTREGLREIFQKAAASPRWRGIVNYDADHDGSKVYQKSPAAADIFGRLINVWPNPWLTDRQGDKKVNSGIATLVIPAAYANVYGYGNQAKRLMQYMGQFL